jgi:hypothetical protein
MENTSPIPDKTELERQQLYLGNEKLKIEMSRLARESEPEKWWSKLAKNVVAIGGIATVAATMYGLYDSYSKTIADREHTRRTEQRVQFEEAVRRLESPGTISKLVGLSVLSGYLNRDNQAFHPQILFTLASLVATERDLQTQAAIANLVSSVSTSTISEQDWFNFQDTLVAQSRALAVKGNLYRHRQLDLSGQPSGEERTARFVSSIISINILKHAAKKYRDYDGIYCVGCDFRFAAFPPGTSFRGSILDQANFNGADLESASFFEAALNGVNFTEANLRRAHFGSSQHLSPHLLHIAAMLESRSDVIFEAPDFGCANLEGAAFINYPLIPVAPVMGVRPARFYKANLRNVHLDYSDYFTMGSPDRPASKSILGPRSKVGEVEVVQGRLAEGILGIETIEKSDLPVSKPVNLLGPDEYDLFRKRLGASFYMADTAEAHLPDGIAVFLRNSEPQERDYDSVFERQRYTSCFPRV